MRYTRADASLERALRRSTRLPDRHLRHRHGLAGRDATAAGLRSGRFRRTRLSAHVHVPRTAPDPGARGVYEGAPGDVSPRSRGRSETPRRSTNAEAAATVELDLPYTSMPEAIYHLFIQGKHSIVVAGTHGKTTTTSLMAWLLESAGRDPSMVVGRDPAQLQPELQAGRRPGVRHRGRRVQHGLLRQGAEVPALPRQHAAPEQHRVRPRRHLRRPGGHLVAFRHGRAAGAPGDVIVANGDDANVRSLRDEARGALGDVRLGPRSATPRHPTSVEHPEGTEFTAWWEGKEWTRFRTTLSGRHNVLNALADAVIARLRGALDGGDPEGAGDVPGDQAPDGSARRRARRHRHRRLRPSPHRHRHDPRRRPQALSGPADLGPLRAALDLIVPEGVRGRIHRRLPRSRPRHHRPGLPPPTLRNALRARQDDVTSRPSSSVCRRTPSRPNRSTTSKPSPNASPRRGRRGTWFSSCRRARSEECTR